MPCNLEESMTLARNDNSIESPRLLLRRIREDDLPFYTRIHADPQVARYLGHGRPRSDEETREWMQMLQQMYELHCLGQLAVVRKEDGALIGRCGLAYFEIEVPPYSRPLPRAWFHSGAAPADARVMVERELGYTLDRSAWGKGYATEATRAVAQYVREVLRMPRFISIIHPENAASLAVARKFDLQREDSVEMADRVYDRYRWPDA